MFLLQCENNIAAGLDQRPEFSNIPGFRKPTLQEAMRWMERQDENIYHKAPYEQRAGQLTSNSSPANGATTAQNGGSDPMDWEANRLEGRRFDARKFDKRTPEQKAADTRKWLATQECFKCHRTGHLKRDCPKDQINLLESETEGKAEQQPTSTALILRESGKEPGDA